MTTLFIAIATFILGYVVHDNVFRRRNQRTFTLLAVENGARGKSVPVQLRDASKESGFYYQVAYYDDAGKLSHLLLTPHAFEYARKQAIKNAEDIVR